MHKIRIERGPSDVSPNPVQKIEQFKLSQNYPNPFNQGTTIEFYLPSSSNVSLKIFASSGKEIATLVSAKLPPGNHRFIWNVEGLSSGIYFYRLIANDPEQAGSIFSQTKKLILLK